MDVEALGGMSCRWEATDLLCHVGMLHICEAAFCNKAASSIASCTQFLNKAREKQRQKSLKQAVGAAGPQPPALDRQLSKAGKRPAEQQAHLPAAKRRLLDGRQDAAELADEYALLRKLKKGKLSEVTPWDVVSLHASLHRPNHWSVVTMALNMHLYPRL